MSITIDAITVCVDYSKYLALTVSNKSAFNRWLIVTVERDTDTIDLCEREGLEYCFSDRLYEDGPFCKGKAINDGILKLDPQDWLCVVDADLYLFGENFKKLLDTVKISQDNLYGLYGRLLAQDEKQLNEMLTNTLISIDSLEHVGMLAGFFQMWHTSIRNYYPEESTHAGLDDILMRDGYSPARRKFLPAYGIHIGPMWVNHKGIPKTT